MGSNKRKRSNDTREISGSSVTAPKNPAFTPVPFTIVYAEPPDSKKRKKGGKKWMRDHFPPNDEAESTDRLKAVMYEVAPGALWDIMKSYEYLIGWLF